MTQAPETQAQKISWMLREIRKREGLTQQGLADASHTKQAGINRLESGTYLQNLDTLARVLDGAGYELRLVAVKKSTCIELTL